MSDDEREKAVLAPLKSKIDEYRSLQDKCSDAKFIWLQDSEEGKKAMAELDAWNAAKRKIVMARCRVKELVDEVAHAQGSVATLEFLVNNAEGMPFVGVHAMPMGHRHLLQYTAETRELPEKLARMRKALEESTERLQIARRELAEAGEEPGAGPSTVPFGDSVEADVWRKAGAAVEEFQQRHPELAELWV